MGFKTRNCVLLSERNNLRYILAPKFKKSTGNDEKWNVQWKLDFQFFEPFLVINRCEHINTTGSRCDKILPGVFTDCHYVTSHHKGIRKDVAWSFWNFDCTFSRKLRCGGRKKFKIPYDLENRFFQSWPDHLVWYTIRRVSASAFQICFQIWKIFTRSDVMVKILFSADKGGFFR